MPTWKKDSDKDDESRQRIMMGAIAKDGTAKLEHKTHGDAFGGHSLDQFRRAKKRIMANLGKQIVIFDSACLTFYVFRG